jgi:hypothetical protein
MRCAREVVTDTVAGESDEARGTGCVDTAVDLAPEE